MWGKWLGGGGILFGSSGGGVRGGFAERGSGWASVKVFAQRARRGKGRKEDRLRLGGVPDFYVEALAEGGEGGLDLAEAGVMAEGE